MSLFFPTTDRRDWRFFATEKKSVLRKHAPTPTGSPIRIALAQSLIGTALLMEWTLAFAYGLRAGRRTSLKSGKQVSGFAGDVAR